MHEYSFEKLRVWQRTRVFVKKIYLLTGKFPDREKFGIVSQLQRAVVSVSLNIAEGSTKEALQQAIYAKAWGAEGLMMLPPMRYKSDHRETVTYFKTIAAATDLPVMIYNNPIDLVYQEALY